MKKLIKQESGFTLIEMMVVLLIISVLLVITIPNIANHNATINEKGCQAYVKMVEAQVQAYKMDKGYFPVTIAELEEEGYLKNGETACSDEVEITIDSTGKVIPVSGS